MNEVQRAQSELIEEFGLFDDWMDRYQFIIDLGRRLPDFPENEKTDANKIRGCQSQVWFLAEMKGDRLHFQAISDAAIVSGLIAVLLRIYSDRKPEDILRSSVDFVVALNFEQHLSPTRSNGLAAMLKAIQTYAAEAVRAA
ncbi:MAG: SufE family protein [Proteobacteria bacterium]|nr:SufE family protein [Pseudomonadota bacterium]MDA0992465.1 SufE family protein [Pseudomonadota bacterium]